MMMTTLRISWMMGMTLLAHDDDDVGQAGAGDCLGAIQLVERECRGLVNSRDHLGRLEL